jgi:amidase
MGEDRSDVQKGSRGISRRSFLRRGALAAAGGAALAQLAPGVPGLAAEPKHGHGRGPSNELEEKTIKQLQEAMETGDLTARDLVEMYLERIEALDRQGPHLRSFIETNPEALDIADRLDEERAGGKVRGPLHGIPIALKDNIDTADRMMTTAGSFALAGPPPPHDSTVAERLREAGAIILGKANLSEWANFRSTRPVSGWSGRGRLCINPYVLDRSGCGSSTGSAVSVAANLTAVSLGTETNGSIVCPSSVCNVVGIKPTVGLWSRAGVVPIGESQDTVGPIGRTVADAATVLGALTGVDPRDERTQESEGHFFKDYTQFLDADGLKGKRIGIARGMGFGHEHSDKVANAAVDAMRGAGAVIVEDPDILRPPSPFPTTLTQVLLFEFKRDVNQYLSTRPDLAVHTLADLIAFNNNDAAREMPYFLQELFLQAQDIEGTFPEDKYREALAANRTLFRKLIDDSISKFTLDAIFAPTRNPAWTVDLLSGDRSLVGSSTPAAVSGFASITVPAGFAFEHLPVGISFTAGAWTEPQLITIASGFEAATKARKPPQFVPHLDLP